MANIKQINVGGTTYNIEDTSKLPLTGGTISGDLIINAPWRDGYYASNLCRHFSTNTPTEFVIKTKIKYVSGSQMPVVRLYGYAYGAQSPIELRIGWYIFDGYLGWSGVVCTGAWNPEVYLFKYTENSNDWVAIGLKGRCYFAGFSVDAQIGALGGFGTNFQIDGWSTQHNGADTTKTLVPKVGTSNCVKVEYKTIKTSISGNAATATNADKLNNHNSSYFAVKGSATGGAAPGTDSQGGHSHSVTINTYSATGATTVTGVSGSTTASKATAGTARKIGNANVGTAVACDDITSWSAGTMTSVSMAVNGNTLELSYTNGTAPALAYTARSITPATTSSDTITPYTFADVTVPKAATVSTRVISGIAAGTVSVNTDSKGAHTHTVNSHTHTQN